MIEGMGSGDPRPVEAALQRGGLFWPDIARLALNRMNGDITRADRDVAEIRAFLHRINLPYDVEPLAYHTDVLDAGNKILHQDIKGWIIAIDAVRHHYASPLRQSMNLPQLRLPDLDVFEPDVPISELPQAISEIASVNTLPYITPERFSGEGGIFPIVQATLDDKEISLSLSTDSFIGDISADMARAGHYRVIGHGDHLSDSFGRKMRANFVVVKTLRLGQSVFHDVIFRVTKTAHPSLGMDFLMQLPRVTMSRQAVHFGSAMPYKCDTPIHLSMNSDGTGLMLIFPLVTANNTSYAPFTSGMVGTPLLNTTTSHFSEREKQRSVLEPSETNYGLGFFISIETPFRATLYGQELDGKLQKTLTTRNTSEPKLALSAALLASGDVSWDFSSRTACFSRKTRPH